MGDGGFSFPLYSVRMKQCGLWIMIASLPAWERMGNGRFGSPLYSMTMKRCGLMWIMEYDRWPSRLEEDGRWWFRFPSLFIEDEMMWTMIVSPAGW